MHAPQGSQAFCVDILSLRPHARLLVDIFEPQPGEESEVGDEFNLGQTFVVAFNSQRQVPSDFNWDGRVGKCKLSPAGY